MKKTSGSTKTQKSDASEVERYIARVPEPGRTTLKKIRATIWSVVPRDATETISYGMPAFRWKGALVGYAAFKNHCSFFPMGSSVLDLLELELKGYRTAKGTLSFPLDKPMPTDLMKKIVKARLAQNKAKKEG
jgi:uncharacterized protein YdhG (YjbR/CyaY superfamily)